MDNQNEICQRLVLVWILELPALVEEIFHLVPLLELQRGFQLEFHDLEMLRNGVVSGGFSELVDTVSYDPAEVLAVLSSL